MITGRTAYHARRRLCWHQKIREQPCLLFMGGGGCSCGFLALNGLKSCSKHTQHTSTQCRMFLIVVSILQLLHVVTLVKTTYYRQIFF